MNPTATQLRDSIRHELLFAQSCRDFWWRAISINEHRESIVAAMDMHAGFFGTCITSFLHSYIVTLTALLEDNKRSICLKTLLKEICKQSTANSQELSNISADLEYTEATAANLRKNIRHKYIAHRSIEVFDKDFYKEAALTHDELRSLWDQCWKIFCVLSFQIDRSNEGPPEDNVSQFDHLITSLSRNHEHHP